MPAPDKRLVVLLGYPLRHSLSPVIHNTAFQHQRLPYEYRLHPVAPDDLSTELLRLAETGFAGANVTVPHKESVARLLNEKSDVVATIGAANTLSCRIGDAGPIIRGDNTDVGGFLAPIQDLLPKLQGGQALVFGSGGAARAVGFGLARSARLDRIVVAARNMDAGRRLADLLRGLSGGCAVDWVAVEEAGPEVRKSRLVVNATPIGMSPLVTDTVWTESSDFHSDQIIYDLIYWPLETRLMREAKARGATVIGGLEMLIAQASLAYAIWTGRQMPLEIVREKLKEHLAGGS